MKRMNGKALVAGLGLSMAFAAALSGCGGTTQPTAAVSAPGEAAAEVAGYVLMSVNPEIELAYDDKGNVVELEGANEDGKSVLADYDDYRGRPADEVMGELVREIDADGYFAGGVGGREKNIVLKVAEGSTYPSDDFMERIAESVKVSAGECGLGSGAYAVGTDRLDGDGLIGIEAAKEIVLGQLGIDPATAKFNDHEYELDDGVYELEFVADGIEYDYEVDARTGKVLEADFERNDDWDDRDMWDDDDDDRDDDGWDGDDDDDRAPVAAPTVPAGDDDWDDDRDDAYDDRDDDWDDRDDNDDWDDDNDDDWDDDNDDDGDDDDWDDDRDDDDDDDRDDD